METANAPLWACSEVHVQKNWKPGVVLIASASSCSLKPELLMGLACLLASGRATKQNFSCMLASCMEPKFDGRGWPDSLGLIGQVFGGNFWQKLPSSQPRFQGQRRLVKQLPAATRRRDEVLVDPA